MTLELLPCPFCGHPARLIHDTSADRERYWRWNVECANFDECEAELTGFAIAEAAVAKWNARKANHTHRNGETTPPTVPGKYWFRGEVTGEITGRYAVSDTIDVVGEYAYNDIHGETLHIWNYAGQWWGAIGAPWEQGE